MTSDIVYSESRPASKRILSSINTFLSLMGSKNTIPYPSPKNPIRGINALAYEKHWKTFCTKYSKVWKTYKGEDAWACCVAIWKNYCLKRKIAPFDVTAVSLTKDTKKDLVNRVKNARESQIQVKDRLVNRLIKEGLATKTLKEVFGGVIKNRQGMYEVITYQRLKGVKGLSLKSVPIRDCLNKQGFSNIRGVFKRATKSLSKVEVYSEGTEIIISYKNTFTPPHLQYILDLNPEDSKNHDKLVKRLSSYWRSLLKNK